MGRVVYKDQCIGCIYLNDNGTCGNKRSVMFGSLTNKDEYQTCPDRWYYSREATKKYRRKRKIQSVYDYE